MARAQALVSENRHLGGPAPIIFHGCEIDPIGSKRLITHQGLTVHGTINISIYDYKSSRFVPRIRKIESMVLLGGLPPFRPHPSFQDVCTFDQSKRESKNNVMQTHLFHPIFFSCNSLSADLFSLFL